MFVIRFASLSCLVPVDWLLFVPTLHGPACLWQHVELKKDEINNNNLHRAIEAHIYIYICTRCLIIRSRMQWMARASVGGVCVENGILCRETLAVPGGYQVAHSCVLLKRTRQPRNWELPQVLTRGVCVPAILSMAKILWVLRIHTIYMYA